MSAVDWDEVKRLAADFQRAQLTSSAQRLSERNCIEIITRLIEEKLLDVIFTTDGKEYITPQHLAKEIRDELYVNGGRINLVDLAKTLCVDLQVVTKKATDIAKSDSGLQIVNGQLISNSYTSTLCAEINEKLQSHGQVDIGELTSQYDLPSEFILSAVEKQLGRTIHGTQDKQDRLIIFTHKFVEKNLAVVRGALLAVTRPINTITLISLIGLPERVFFSAVESLVERKEMPGVLTGKQRAAGQFVPYVYTRAQQQWVADFYQQNGYVEFQSLTRMGISDPQGFVQRNVGKDKLILLPSVAVGPALRDQIEAAVDEAIASNTFVKLLQLVPSVFDEEDAHGLLQTVLQGKQRSTAQPLHVFDPAVLVTELYMKNVQNKYKEKIEKLSRKYVESGEYLKQMTERSSTKPGAGAAEDRGGESKADRKEERRRKAAEGKAGGGAQGRETKTKSTKKKGGKGRQVEDSDDEDKEEKPKKMEIVSRDDVLAGLQGEELIMEEDSDTLLQQLTDYLHPALNKLAAESAQAIFETTIASAHAGRRRRLQQLQDKLSDLLLNVKLFEKGLKHWEADASVHSNLTKYLLKSVCTDITNEILAEVGERESPELTAEQRTKIIADSPPEIRSTLTALNKTLGGSNVEDFFAAAETALGPSGVDIMVYKHDKKKERGGIVHQRELLSEQLRIASDPALILHLTSLLVFQATTQCILHASGKFVSNIISFVKDKIPPTDHDALKTCHDIVLQYLSNPDARSDLSAALEELMPKIKEIALSAHKPGKGRDRTNSTNEN